MEQMNENTSQKKSLLVPLIILGILLIGSIVYNVVQGNKISSLEKNELLTGQMIKKEASQKENLQQEYDSLINEYSEFKARIEDKDNLLGDNENMIRLKNQDIQQLMDKENPTAKELEKAQGMIASLRSEIGTYKTQVAKLQKENAILVRNVDDLNTKNQSLTTSNQQLNENNKELSYNLDTEKNVRSKESAISSGKIDELSSTLSISNHEISGIKVRNNGKEKETNRARRIDKIRVNFDIDRNSRAESGNKTLYVAIYGPNGALGKYSNAKSGQLELRSGDTVNYSDVVTFNYVNGQGKTISFDWENDQFEKGVYRIDVYQNGYKISQAKITLS